MGVTWVYIWRGSARLIYFFSGQGTRLPLETSATHRSKECSRNQVSNQVGGGLEGEAKKH